MMLLEEAVEGLLQRGALRDARALTPRFARRGRTERCQQIIDVFVTW